MMMIIICCAGVLLGQKCGFSDERQRPIRSGSLWFPTSWPPTRGTICGLTLEELAPEKRRRGARPLNVIFNRLKQRRVKVCHFDVLSFLLVSAPTPAEKPEMIREGRCTKTRRKTALTAPQKRSREVKLVLRMLPLPPRLQ